MMALRIKALVCLVLIGAVASVWSILGHPAEQWLHFFAYLAAVLLSSRMKVGLPKTEASMSVNFPFILLGILQLSPLQAACLTACSVFAQCRIQVSKPFTLVQVLFNVANATTATVLAWYGYVALVGRHWEMAPALAAAATIYFFSNTAPLALVIAWDQGANALVLWHRDFRWFLPFYLVGAGLAAAANLIGIAFGWMTSLLLIPMVYIIYRAYTEQMAMLRDRERQAMETEALHLRTIEGLAMAIEAKDQNTHRHLMRVRVYVAELGKRMGLDEPLMKALSIAAFLHDIGKLAVPEYIINKPGKLTPEEFEKMKIHPVVGADILERVRFPYPVVPIVRSHHEAWDGSGYPDGLKGEEIPIGARLLTAVDCFDAIASDRPYRKALPLDQAIAFVKSKAGKQFDPGIVELLAKHHLELEEKARLHIQEVEPLKTDWLIHRGAAPGAGFALDQGDGSARGPAATALGASNAAAQGNPNVSSPTQWIEAGVQEKGLIELNQQLEGSQSSREIASQMSSGLRALIPNDCFAIYLKSGESLQGQFMDGVYSRAFSMGPTAIGAGLSGWVAEHARPIVNGNPTVEPSYLSETGLLTETGSALAVPLFDAAGSVFGVVTLYAASSVAFSREHLRILQEIEPKFSASLRNALLARVAEESDRHKHLDISSAGRSMAAL
jgi:putative nucleotidyltransferase with HDIG domain